MTGSSANGHSGDPFTSPTSSSSSVQPTTNNEPQQQNGGSLMHPTPHASSTTGNIEGSNQPSYELPAPLLSEKNAAAGPSGMIGAATGVSAESGARDLTEDAYTHEHLSQQPVHDLTKLQSSSSLHAGEPAHHLDEDTVHSHNSSNSSHGSGPHKHTNDGTHVIDEESVSIDLKKIQQTAAQHGKAEPHADVMKDAPDGNFDKAAAQGEFSHPEQAAGFWSYILLLWMNPIINRGFKTPITLPKTPEMRTDMTAEYLTTTFCREWDREVETKGENASIAWALHRSFGYRYWLAGFCMCVSNGIGFITPNLLNFLIIFIEDAQLPVGLRQEFNGGWYGYTLAVGMFLCGIVTILLTNEFYKSSLITGIKVRAALIGAIYQKSLRLSPAARAAMSTGQIVNMMSVDCTKIDLSCQFFHFGWTTIIQVCISIALLIWQLSYNALPGIAIMLIFMPVQGVVMKYLGQARAQGAKKTDTRLKTMNEVLQGIRVIKVYAWERSFLAKMIDVRAAEVKFVRFASSIRGLNGVLNTGLPAVMNFLPFMTLSLTSATGRLNPADVFTALVYLNMIRIPVIVLPITFSMAADTRVAFGRISKYLLADELAKSAQPTIVDSSHPNAVEIRDATFTWDVAMADPMSKPIGKEKEKLEAKEQAAEQKQQDERKIGAAASTAVELQRKDKGATDERRDSQYVFGLENINLVVPKGSLVAVIGAVGCGKSSLLQGLLGEMKRTKGEVLLSGNAAYCPQQAWIMNATLKDNILFGLPYDEERYQQAIKACALESDLKQLPAGDATEIGERGINLSGGQKQRVSLARSVYFDADMVLYDDVLSAVDAHVSKYLFAQCINGALKDKTRVLVTHQLQYCNRVDWIVHLKDGKILEQGTYHDLMGKRSTFFNLMMEFGGAVDEELNDGTSTPTAAAPSTDVVALKRQSSSGHRANVAGQESQYDEVDVKKAAAAGIGKELITQEDKASGTLKADVWLFYMHANGGWIAFAFFIFWVCATLASRFLTDWWLTRWTACSYAELTQADYIGIYAALTGAQFIAGGFYNIFLANRSVRAAVALHNQSFAVILRAPMSFFDTTPIGRIMNRFSRDQDVIDNLLMMEGFRMLFYWIGTAIGTLIMIGVFNPWFAIAIPPILIFFYITQTYYRRTSRELKRMDSITRSPLFAFFSETLTGLSTIRAYRRSEVFVYGNYLRMDNNNRPYYLLQCSSRWLGERLEFLGACVTFLAAAIGTATRDSINPGVVGLSLSYALSLTQVLSFMVRNVVDTENNMNSVERCKSYIDNIEQEAAAILPTDKDLPKDWPSQGNVELKGLSLRYRDGLPLVLKQLSASIKGGERIGVVGRTGAGKSSMMLAMFRLVEASEGSIEIDGVDIGKLGLETLRSKLAIMPQDPVLYSGTIRSNLDPFNEHKDIELWQALEKAYLKEQIEKQDLKLDAPVTEGGENWSIGQRCQICLARALLRHAKILIMDEATASIDLQTDDLIQQSLRKEFKCTVLTIAHRLNTIMDYDRVMVLSFGRIKEFKSPADLLRDKDSIFTSMVNETGEETAQLLRKIAFDAETRRKEGKGTDYVPVANAQNPEDSSTVFVKGLDMPMMPRQITAEDERKASEPGRRQ